MRDRSKACRSVSRWLAVALSAPAVFLSSPLRAGPAPGIELRRIQDQRIAHKLQTGFLNVELKLKGDGLDAFKAYRVLPAEARDDSGTSLLPARRKEPSFAELSGNSGTFSFQLENPPRRARTVSISGVVQLFEPGRDPAATVRVEKAFSRLDKPLSAKGLKAAKIELTPLSKERYLEEKKKQKLDEKRIALIRKEAKEEGLSDEQVDAMIELAKAFDEMGGPGDQVGDNAVFLAAKTADFERIQAVSILGGDGKEIRVGFSTGGGDGTTTVRRYDLAEPAGPNASLVLTIRTEKSIVPIPFDIREIPLP